MYSFYGGGGGGVQKSSKKPRLGYVTARIRGPTLRPRFTRLLSADAAEDVGLVRVSVGGGPDSINIRMYLNISFSKLIAIVFLLLLAQVKDF